MITVYHGTTLQAAKQILANGFHPGSFFATTADHAVIMGARHDDALVYLFTVTLPPDYAPHDDEPLGPGELRVRTEVPPGHITRYQAVPRPLQAVLP